jgi:hypothetical protein
MHPCLAELLARLPVDDLRRPPGDTAAACPGTGGRPGSAADGRSPGSASRSPAGRAMPDIGTGACGGQHPTAAAPGRVWEPQATTQPAPGQAARHLRPGGVRRPRIITRPVALAFVSSFGALASFYLLLSVVPLYATSAGAGATGAGLVTGALMFSTMAAELATPRLMARFGYRLALGAGLLLLGVPALALPASADMAAIVAVCALRGLGFGVTVVVGSALMAALFPAEHRGEGLGIYGIVVGVPAVVGLPLGIWLAGHTGYPPVFVAGAVAALAGLAAVPGLPGLPGRQSVPGKPLGVLAGLARQRWSGRRSFFWPPPWRPGSLSHSCRSSSRRHRGTSPRSPCSPRPPRLPSPAGGPAGTATGTAPPDCSHPGSSSRRPACSRSS